MTEAKIIKDLAQWVDDRRYPYQIPNAFIYSWECDYWVLSAYGETKEFEIKISRQDYLKDAKKDKHTKEGANFFYYVCPEGLIKKEEIDKRYGLIYINQFGSVKIEKKPRKLHDNKFDNWQLLANKMYWRFRNLWKEKYLNKEITRDQYWEGFNLELELVDSNPALITPSEVNESLNNLNE